VDRASYIGLVGCVVCCAIGIFVATGGNVMPYVDIPSIFITIFGSFFANMLCFPMEMTTKGMPQATKFVFTTPQIDLVGTIKTIVEFAQKARRDGLLALENEAEAIENPFFKKGIRLVVDGTDPELVRSILEIEMQYMDDRHKGIVNYYFMWGSLAPAFGMIGTLIGLVGMLLVMADGDMGALGANMAAALLTTLYGSLMANVALNPFATKLSGLNADEMLLNELIVEGILSMQAGENPRIIEEKLMVFLSGEQRLAIRGEREREEV